jgi:DNA (cytosine-5)-methyltransferase 1
MTCGDLFAGIGGMSLGLHHAGFTVRWQVEREPFCENVLARHWPDVVRRRDVRFAGAGTLEPVDLIAGGFPCQDISAAGKGTGLERGHRSGLWREFARIVRELRPRWVLVENVPALRRRGADTVLGDLEAAGYACWPLVVGARHVGAPHRRDRVWIVGRMEEPNGGRRDGGPHDKQSRGAFAQQASAGVADADVERSRRERRGGLLDDERAARGNDAHGCNLAVGLADCDPTRLEGRRVPGCERADQWPAGPASRPHDWEEPRTVESPLGRAAHGLSRRLAGARWRNELKALGNAVVPQVVEVIGRAILAVEHASCAA